ncbi:endonuclease VII domain-containing protein [Streptomyces sp. NPDC015171]|uniref:endonuclease VII domain-containing protein n=1 Tax=Streptomyces sp. NPDC015171 TaxID=3364945 RepID=UPI0036FC6FE2
MSGEQEVKRCSRCRQARPRAAFARDTAALDGRPASGRETDPHGEWHRGATASGGLRADREVCRAAEGPAGHPKRQYGLTRAERDGPVASRGGVRCICPAAPAAHVDHCHETGRVRGVLCFSCNAALGQFKDQPETIRRAAAYVEGIAWKPTLVAPGVYQLPS